MAILIKLLIILIICASSLWFASKEFNTQNLMTRVLEYLSAGCLLAIPPVLILIVWELPL